MWPNSDKFFWHRYIEFYDSVFQHIEEPVSVCEIGIYRGDSIQWLLTRFPKATIFAADILPFQAEWPNSSRVKYFQFDQSNKPALEDFFCISRPEIIIEDGSHIPEHQAVCLVSGVKALKSNGGGIYILEDVHTSHPYYVSSQQEAKNCVELEKLEDFRGNAFTLLMAIQHLKDLRIGLDAQSLEKLSLNSLFEADEVRLLYDSIIDIQLYRRTKLPIRCYNCKSSSFDYHNQKCICGVPIFSDTDSMSFALTVGTISKEIESQVVKG